MNTRRLVLLASLAALVVGFVALLIPVSTSNGSGGVIGCGSGLSSDLSAAREANSNSVAGVRILKQVLSHNDYVAQCNS
ncbi:MAG: aminopeptidase, partial [Mycobacterium sp.]